LWIAFKLFVVITRGTMVLTYIFVQTIDPYMEIIFEKFGLTAYPWLIYLYQKTKIKILMFDFFSFQKDKDFQNWLKFRKVLRIES
jgi:hypothetical protein